MVVVLSRPRIFFAVRRQNRIYFFPLPFNHSRPETRVLKDGRDDGAHGSRVSARGVGRRMGQPPCSHTGVNTRSRLLFFDGLSLLLLLFRCTHAHRWLDPLGGGSLLMAQARGRRGRKIWAGGEGTFHCPLWGGGVVHFNGLSGALEIFVVENALIFWRFIGSTYTPGFPSSLVRVLLYCLSFFISLADSPFSPWSERDDSLCNERRCSSLRKRPSPN